LRRISPIALSLVLPLAVASVTLAQTTMPAAPASQPTTNPAAVAAVQEALAKYNKAVESADVKTLVDSVYVSSEPQKKALALMGRLTTAGRELYDAAVATYGAAELEKDNVAKSSFPAGYPQLAAEGLNVKVDGDKATLNSPSPDAPPGLTMINKDGWKIDGDALLPAMTDKQLNDQTTILNAAIAAIQDVTTDVKAGKFRGADEALVVMNLRVQKGVRAAQAKLAPMVAPSTEPGVGPANGPVGPTTSPAMP